MSPRPPTLPVHLLATALLAGAVLLAAAPAAPAAANAPGGTTPANALAAPPTPTGDGAVLVVDGDDDGDDAYATIQAAVDAADAGDTVAVRPGTYAETVVLEESVTVVARDGATLSGSTLDDDAVAFTVAAGSGAAPTVAGFTVTGYDTGVNASRTDGDWTVRNLTVRSAEVGVDAVHASGDWTVVGSNFSGHKYAVFAWYADGDWTVRNSTFRANGKGVYAARTVGDWLVANSSFRTHAHHGVDATAAEGNWTVRDSRFLNNQYALTAEGARGHWRVAGSAFAGSNFSAVWAADAIVEGDATGNWWGNPDGPDRDDCFGNVDCSGHLTTAPVDDEAFLNRVDTSVDIREADAGRWNTSVDTTAGTSTPPAGGGIGTNSGPLLSRWQTVGLVVVLLGVPLLALRRYGLPTLV